MMTDKGRSSHGEMSPDSRPLLRDEMMRSAVRPGRVPPVASWIITARCNMRCLHCYPEASPEYRGAELSAEEHFRIVTVLEKASVRCVVISGGEPLILKHLYDLVAAITAKGMEAGLCSNGSLIDEGRARRLRKAGIRFVSISIDGADAATHDALRCFDGAYARALHAIRLLTDAGVQVMADYTAVRPDPATLPQLRDRIRQAGAISLNVKRFRPLGRGRTNASVLTPPIDEYRRFMDAYLREDSQPAFACADDPAAYAYRRLLHGQEGPNPHSLASEYGCLAGLGWFGVLQNGDVTPCPLLQVRIGSILVDDLPTLFAQAPAVRNILNRDQRTGACGTCSVRASCGGCRAHAQAEHGDYLAEDPYCLVVHHQRRSSITPDGKP